YNGAKAAASHLTRMLATELALKGMPVRVNAVAPGVYASEMTADVIEGTEAVAKIAQSVMPVPAGRFGTSRARSVYLSSLAGCYTNEQEIMVDEGYTAVNP
ncbi:hypothetical protein FA95DRAFT_1506735, partial [Auriscalpium vulgare]